MPYRLEILCVSKRYRYSPHERISYIGGRNQDGSLWRLTLEDAIAGIKQGKWNFYVNMGGRSIGVIIANHFGNEYLKTSADGEVPDNLLSLPECF